MPENASPTSKDSKPLDAPLTDPGDDLLERDGFARLIANAILQPRGDGATTYAISGSWGSGKSTVANFVKRHLDGKADVIPFEPWMVGTSEALIGELFLEIGKKAFPVDENAETRKKRQAFWSYGANVLDVVKVSGKALGLAGVPGMSLAGELAGNASEAAKDSAKQLEDISKRDTLREARDRIKSDLADLPCPIVVIIDDVDRLEAEEIRTLFRVVKACADFPNVRYLLLFDRPQVSRALGGKEGQGEEFLEKIVNLMFDLPVIGDEKRLEILRKELVSITSHATEREASERVDEVFERVLKPGLPTVRMAKRFAATAAALASGMEDAKGANYDAADFLVLEFLRAQYPEVYRLAGAYKIEPIDLVRNRANKEDPPGTPWSRAMHAAIESAGKNETLVRAAVKMLRPDVNLDTGENQTGAFPPADSFKRFFNPLWQGMYLGFDRSRVPLAEDSWHRFASLLEGSGEHVSLPKELMCGTEQPRVAESIVYRVNALSLQALDRLTVLVMRWAEPRAKDGPDQEAITATRVSAGAGIIQAALNERWARDEEVLEHLDHLTAEADSPVMRAVLLADLDSMINRRGREFWGTREEVKQKFQTVVEWVEALQNDKIIFTVPGSDFVIRAWSRFVGKTVSQTWYDNLHFDVDLMVTYVEHQYAFEDASREFNNRSGESTFAQAVLNLPFERLGPRGREVQKLLREGKEKFEREQRRLERTSW